MTIEKIRKEDLDNMEIGESKDFASRKSKGENLKK